MVEKREFYIAEAVFVVKLFLKYSVEYKTLPIAIIPNAERYKAVHLRQMVMSVQSALLSFQAKMN